METLLIDDEAVSPRGNDTHENSCNYFTNYHAGPLTPEIISNIFTADK